MRGLNPWIRTDHELADFVAQLAGCRKLALDTESDSLYHHFEKVCLIQVAAEGLAPRLIDPLALTSLQVLASVMADEAVAKVLHGADYDVTTLKRDFGFRFCGLWDTMIAARLLGRTEFGLQALVRSELGIELQKGAQKDDWSRRPLTPRQESYALADVEHLLVLQQRLSDELATLGRSAWLQEECDAVAELPAARRRQDPDAYQKIKGARELSARGLAILRELHIWRESYAEKTNIPPFKILQPTTLLLLASNPPARDALLRLPEMRRLPREAPSLLAAIARAQALPEEELPQIVAKPWARVSAETKARTAALNRLRQEIAKAETLDVSIVLPQRLIDKVAEANPRTLEALAAIEGLRRWRVAVWGEKILAALS